MKYILRIVVVAVICVGIFFGISAIVNNKKPYSICDDFLSVQANFKEVDAKISLLNGMTEDNMDKFFQQNSIYGFSKNCLNDFIYKIEVLNLKNKSSEIKAIKKELNANIEELKTSIQKIYDYKLNGASASQEILSGLIDSANVKFLSFNKSLNNACLKFQSLVDTEVYDGVNYNFKDVLISNLLDMSKVYLENDKGYEQVAKAIDKFNAYKNSNKPSSISASSFVQNYHSFTNASLLNLYKNYFEQGTSSNLNFNLLINFVLTGEYYEKV